MPLGKSQFEQENAMLFAKFEELSGKLNLSLAQNKSDAQKIKGLSFELSEANESKEKLKEKLKKLKDENAGLLKRLSNLNALEKQNFTISNKIAKIVTDIDNPEVREDNWKELIESLISQVDSCIGLLEE